MRSGTYRTLDEQSGALSPAEQRFEKARRSIGLFAGPVLALVVWLLTGGLTNAQQMLAAVLTFVLVYWITEAIPIPVTAVLGLALTVLTGVAPAAEVFGAFASSTIFLFIGGFILAEAMMRHGLDRRFAFRVLALPGVARSTTRTVVAFGVVALLLSAFISNTAATAMLFPIALGIVGTLAGLVAKQSGSDAPVDPSRLRFSTALMLMTAYGASVGGLLTPIGSPPNLIGREFIETQTDARLPFFTWMLNAVPVVLLMFVALCVILLILNRPETHDRGRRGVRLPGAPSARAALARGAQHPDPVRHRRDALGPARCAVAGRRRRSGALRRHHRPARRGRRRDHRRRAAVPAPVDWGERRFTLNWNEASRIDWGTILLFGSGIALGKLLSSTGLAKEVGASLSTSLGVTSCSG